MKVEMRTTVEEEIDIKDEELRMERSMPNSQKNTLKSLLSLGDWD